MIDYVEMNLMLGADTIYIIYEDFWLKELESLYFDLILTEPSGTVYMYR